MIAALPIAALALAATPATEAETRRIQAQLDTASQLFEKGLYADAHEVLRGVEETLGAEGEASFPLLRFMMARCLDAMGRHDEALAALARFEALARTDDERRLAADWRARSGRAASAGCGSSARRARRRRSTTASPRPARRPSRRCRRGRSRCGCAARAPSGGRR